MERSDLIAQYDRFISQVREEIKELYWLYNFFFVIESTLIGAIFIKGFDEPYLSLARIAGLVLAIYWLWITHKQKSWRNKWLSKITAIEEKLEYPEEYRMWPKDPSSIFHFVLKRNGLWLALLLLPIGFTTMWLTLIFDWDFILPVMATLTTMFVVYRLDKDK